MMEDTLVALVCRDLQDLQVTPASWDLQDRRETVEPWGLKEMTDCPVWPEIWVPWAYLVPWVSRDLRVSWVSLGLRDPSG